MASGSFGLVWPHADESDAAADARSARYHAAEWDLLIAPAPLPWSVMRKWEVLDRMLARDAQDGETVGRPIIVAVAAIKADVLSLGLCDPEP